MKKLLVIALGVGCASLATAEDKKAAPAKAGDKSAAAANAGPPKAAPEFVGATKYFIGSWSCDGKMPAGPWGPEAKMTSKLGFKMDMNNFWMILDGEQKSMGAQPMTMSFRGNNSYDPSTKKLMRMDYDSMGGIMHMSSPGWEGNKLVFSGEGMMMGQKMKIRHTMTKKSDTEFASAFETAGADGKFSPMGDDVCKKDMTKK
jgi:hypothetical protein